MFEIVEAFLKCRPSTIKVCTWTCGPRNLSLGCDCVERGRAVHILWKEAGKGASLKWDIYGCLEMLSHLSRKAGDNGTSSNGKLEKNRRPAAMPREGNIYIYIHIYIYICMSLMFRMTGADFAGSSCDACHCRWSVSWRISGTGPSLS